MLKIGRSPALVGGLVATLALASSATATASTPSRTSAVARGLAPLRARGATPARAQSSAVTVTVVLAPRNASALDALVARPHAPLSTAQFDARFAPARSTVGRRGRGSVGARRGTAVRGWLPPRSRRPACPAGGRVPPPRSGVRSASSTSA